MRFSPASSVVALALTLACCLGLSDRNHAGASAGPTADAGAAPGHAGMRVAIDPESGELTVPGPELQKALDAELAEMLSRSSEGLVREVLPDGTVRVNLQGRFQNASVATIDAQGRLHTGCVNDAAAVQALANGTAPANSLRCNHTDACSALEVK